MRRGEGQTFFGRESELRILLATLREAAVGTGRLVLLAGEPGIGKTRIASEVAAHAEDDGFLALWGRCHETEGAPAYWPWRQIGRAFREHAPRRSDELTRIERRLAAPEAARDVAPEQARFDLFERVAVALRSAARERPLLIVLDDLHWADAASVKLLQYVGRALVTSPIVVLGTFRERDPATPDDVAALLGEVAALGTSLPLRGLARDDVARLVAARGGGEASPRIVERIHEATRGNPLFVDEVVRLLLAEDRLRDPASAASPLPIPLGVRATIARRLDALAPETRELLAAGAVCGAEFSLDVLARVLGRPLASLRTAVAAAERVGVVARGDDSNGRFVFAHALLRETLEEGLSSATRAAWHRRIGEALEAAHASDPAPYLSELAHHFRAAGDPAYVARAVDYGHRAGDAALRLLAYEDAERELGAALASLEHDPAATTERRCAILLALAEARRGSGRVEPMAATFRQAIELARGLGPATFAEAVLRFSAARFETSFFDDALVALLEDALAQLPADGSALRARLLARLAAAIHLQPGTEQRRAALAEEATLLARALGDKGTLAWVLMMRVIALLGPDNVHERLALAGEILRLAEEGHHGIAALEALTWRVHDLLELGDVRAMELAIDAFARRAQALRQPVYLWHLATWRGMRALLDGRLADAEPLLEQALDAGRRALQETALMHYGQQLLALRWDQGRIRELEGLIRMAVEQAPTVPSWRIELCTIALQNGRLDEAQAMLDALAVHDFADLPRDTNWLIAVTSLAFSATELGDAARASRLYALLEPYEGRFVASRPAVIFLGAVSFFLGRLARTLGRLDVAAAHYERALREHQQLRALPWVARTQVEYASLLAERGRAADEAPAREHASAAHETCERLGLAELLPRAARAVREVRARSEGDGWLEVEGARLAVVGGSRRALVAAAGRGASAVVSLPARRADARPDAEPAERPRVRAARSAPRDAELQPRYALRREGEIWTVVFEGRVVRERHSRGLGYIAHLLAHPDCEVAAWDLVALDGVPASDGLDPAVARARGFEPGGHVAGVVDDALVVGDARAIGDYRRRLAELREETEEAHRQNDIGRSERLDEEIRFLQSELARMVGLGTRSRRAHGAAERARLRVTKAIRYAIRKLAAHDAGLGEHLDVSVKTGMLCAYAPRPRLTREWSVG